MAEPNKAPSQISKPAALPVLAGPKKAGTWGAPAGSRDPWYRDTRAGRAVRAAGLDQRQVRPFLQNF